MRYNLIREMDIANGPGIRVSIFMQGCEFNCKNCFNPETHDFNGGKEFTAETIKKVLEASSKEYIAGLSILGGEPMHPKNIEATELIAKEFKKKYPNKNVWVWSGFKYEDYLKKQKALDYIDVIVDGQFDEKLRNPNLKWKGSSNQRVIDVKESKKQDKIILFCE